MTPIVRRHDPFAFGECADMSARQKNTFSSTAVALALASSLGIAPAAHANDWSSLGLDGARGRASDEKSGAPFSPAWNASPSSAAFVASPAVVDGLLVLAGVKGDLSALRATDGAEVWTVKAAGNVGASPAIDRGRIFVPTLSGKLQALRLASGAEVWTQPFGGQNYASPVVTSDGMGPSLLLGAGFPQQKVVRLSAATGAVQWETPKDAVAGLISSSVAVGKGQVMFGMNGGRYQSLDPLTGATAWKVDMKGYVGMSAPLIVGTTAYFLPGGAAAALGAANVATGELVAGWPVQGLDPAAPAATAYTSARTIVSSPALLGDLVVFVARFEYDLKNNANGTAGGHVLREILFAVDRATASIAWQQEIGRKDVQSINEIPELAVSPTPASFATESDPLVAVTSSIAPKLAIFDIGGKQVWGASLSAPTRSSPVLANGVLYAATDLGVVHAFTSDLNRAPLAPTSGFEPAEGGFVEGPTPALKWAAAQDREGQALRYQVRLLSADGNVFEPALATIDTSAGETQVVLERGLVKQGSTYRYAVRSRDDHGAWSDWSAPQSFIAAVTPPVSVDGKEYDTLKDAIAAVAASGGVVDIGRGLLHLSGLQVPAGVTLAGVSPHDTILDAGGAKVGVELTAGNGKGVPTLKNVTVTGADVGVQVGDAQGAVLRNVVVRDNKKAGVQVQEGATADAINVTIARNPIGASVSGKLAIRSSLVVSNETGLQRLGAGLVTSRYNDVHGNKTANYEDMAAGTGDISVAVTFRSTADFHLSGLQPTTDKGDPADGYGLEPQPNGARVNMGAYGNTRTAELSESTAGWTAVTGAKAAVPAAPAPTVDSPPTTAAPGGGGSGCAVGGGSSGSFAGLLLAVGAALLGRRRRD
jgi:outer membrane protein assembly factor BamB